MAKRDSSAYRIMWLFVMFDLPVGTAEERKEATKFRERLLDLGFEMSQFSVYLKYCSSSEKATAVVNKIPRLLPSGGRVDALTITDKQYSNMKRYYGRVKRKKGPHPRQLHLF